MGEPPHPAPSLAPSSHDLPRFDNMFRIAENATFVENAKWVVIGDTVILSFTLLGATFILGNMARNEIRGRAATTRMRLVQSLIFSDFMMGLIGLIGCGLSLSSKPLAFGSNACDGLGVIMAAVVFTQHCWTLLLAFATFMILKRPLHTVTLFIEKYSLWAWLFVWSISFGIGVLGYKLYGYEPTGGICFYGDNTGLYGELIRFIPRATVFLCIALLYGRLYIFLKRPDKIRTGHSSHSTGGHSSHSHKHSWLHAPRLRPPRRLPLFGTSRQVKTVVVDEKGNRLGIDSGASKLSAPSGLSHLSTESAASRTSLASQGSRKGVPKPKPPPLVAAPGYASSQKRSTPSKPVTPTTDIPPWERIELPVFQVDGHRYGGVGDSGREPGRGEWRFSRKRFSGSHRADASAESPSRAVFDKHQPLSFAPSGAGTSSMPAALDAVNEEMPLHPASMHTGSSGGTTAVDWSPLGSARDRPSRGSQSSADTGLDAGGMVKKPEPVFERHSGTLREDGGTIKRRSSLPDFRSDPVVDPPGRRPSHIPFSYVPAYQPPAVDAAVDETDEDAGATHASRANADVEKGMPVSGVADDDGDDDEDDWDIHKFLAQDNGPSDGRDRFEITTKSDKVEYVPESMASYLNRKTALLMLWFPLGYVALFSVSLIHIIYDFASRPPLGLRAISRWMIFGQGVLDAIIYGFVEWHTKRVVRRRVRKGTFSGRGSRTSGSNTNGRRGWSSRFRSGAGTGTGSRGAGTKSGAGAYQSASQTASQIASPTASQPGRRTQTGTVSFVDPETSILARVDENRAPLDE